MIVDDRAGRSRSAAWRYLAAAAIAVPVGLLAWVQILYLAFGVTGDDSPRGFAVGALAVSLALAFAIALAAGPHPAQVIRRGCQAGIAIAIMLPLVALAVLMLWEHSTGRRDLGMGGLMLFSMPFVAAAAAVMLVIVFAAGSWIAGRWLRPGYEAEGGGA